MHPVIEGFLERPTSHKVAFFVGSLAFLGFVFWTYFYGPLDTQIAALEEEVQTLQTQIVNEQRLANNLSKFRGEVKDLDAKLQFALQELPDKREIPDLLSSISNLARDAGLEVKLFKPRPENIRDFYAEVPVEISVSGTFHQVATFFDEVGQLSRIVNINNIFLRDPVVGPNLVTLNTDCVATTFRYLDEAERAAMQGAGANSSGQRRRK